MEYFIAVLFIYSIYSFLRIGQLHKYIDNELVDIWNALKNHLEQDHLENER